MDHRLDGGERPRRGRSLDCGDRRLSDGRQPNVVLGGDARERARDSGLVAGFGPDLFGDARFICHCSPKTGQWLGLGREQVLIDRLALLMHLDEELIAQCLQVVGGSFVSLELRRGGRRLDEDEADREAADDRGAGDEVEDPIMGVTTAG